ncbi:ATP-dependent zinc metalloprotease FtsH [Methylomusa anaerophila]|nr:ATP-dependent zinc metalloprotease FtsH [Methylomusa anaerophila]
MFKRLKRLGVYPKVATSNIGFQLMLYSAGGLFYLLQQIQNRNKPVAPVCRSQAKPHKRDTSTVTFMDVAGVDEAKQELEEILEFIRHPKRFSAMGARVPKGVLLYGPPGTGKTLLAKALAGEAGVPFLNMSGSEFVEMFVGVGASRVRDLFKEARMKTPCIVFIDEIDAVGRQRGTGIGGSHDEREQTLNQLLVEMDGFNAKKGIVVIAATNRPDVLDPALLRPGRFDRQIVVDRPDLKGRLDILQVHTRGKPLANGLDLMVIARRTPGFTGADLGNLVNEAALLAIRRGTKCIEMNDMEEAVDRVMAGPQRKSRVMSNKDKKLTAYHEAGHALVGMLLPHTDPIHKVSIISRGRAGGYTLTLPAEDHYYQTRSELFSQLTVLFGGQAAEALAFGEVSNGGYNDLVQATELARKMVCEYGMSEVLGPITYVRRKEQVFLGRDILENRDCSEKIAGTIDNEIHRLIQDACAKAEEIIGANIKKLNLIANSLLQRETLSGEELKNLLNIPANQ